MQILLVEDDDGVASALVELLGQAGDDVVRVTTGSDALHRVKGCDLVLLDLGLPDMDGLDVLRVIRRASPVPVLIMTARDSDGAVVLGLRAGADDYLVKPFAYEELAARLRALGRRGVGVRRPEPRLVVGPIVLDETSRRVTLDGRTIDLSPREFSLLECLLRHPGQTLSRDQLLDQAWPFSVAVTPNAVDAYIHYLREKLGGAGRLIETVRGVGYRLADA